MSQLRKFEIVKCVLSPGGPGPERAYSLYYRAIKNKKWIEDKLWIIANSEKQARSEAMSRFGGTE